MRVVVCPVEETRRAQKNRHTCAPPKREIKELLSELSAELSVCWVSEGVRLPREMGWPLGRSGELPGKSRENCFRGILDCSSDPQWEKLQTSRQGTSRDVGGGGNSGKSREFPEAPGKSGSLPPTRLNFLQLNNREGLWKVYQNKVHSAWACCLDGCTSFILNRAELGMQHWMNISSQLPPDHKTWLTQTVLKYSFLQDYVLDACTEDLLFRARWRGQT